MKMMKSFGKAWLMGIGSAGFLLCAIPHVVFAQDAQPTPPTTEQPATPQPAPQPATPQFPASHMAAAREVVQLSGMSDSLEALIPQVLNRTHLSIARQRPELAKQLEETSNTVLLQLVPQREEMLNIAASAFAREMPEADLVAIATFFKSPPGKAYVDKQQKLVRDVLLSMQPWTDQLNRTVFDMFREEMKKKGVTL
jgi:uncharacterized protein